MSIRLDGTGLKRLTPSSFEVGIKHDWSPNGKLIVFTAPGDPASGKSANVWVMRSGRLAPSGRDALTDAGRRARSSAPSRRTGGGSCFGGRTPTGYHLSPASSVRTAPGCRCSSRARPRRNRSSAWGTAALGGHDRQHAARRRHRPGSARAAAVRDLESESVAVEIFFCRDLEAGATNGPRVSRSSCARRWNSTLTVTRPAGRGQFDVFADGRRVFSKHELGRFPEAGRDHRAAGRLGLAVPVPTVLRRVPFRFPGSPGLSPRHPRPEAQRAVH